jgi:ABC-type transport system involved in multi-copper enzyme maturation permease subunit
MVRPPLPELPLLRKELVGLLRTKRAFWLLVATVAGSSLLSLFAWPASSAGITDSQRVAMAAAAFLLTQLTAALALVPAFAAGAISTEREQGTYELLLATRLSPAAIVISKALASAGYVAAVLAACAPSVILLHLLGGVSFESVIRCQAVTLAAVVLATMVCLWASMRAARTSRAVVLGVGGVILWNGGLYWILSLVAMVAAGTEWLPGEIMRSLGFALSPHVVVAMEVFGGTGFVVAGARSSLTVDAWVVHVAFASLVSACYLLLLLRRAGSPEPSVPRGGRLRARPAAGPPTPLSWPFLTSFLLDMGEDGRLLGNPVFRKEIRSEFFGRLWYRRRRFWGLFIVFGALVLSGSIRSAEETIATIAGISILLVSLLSPGIAASAFPREIEHGNLDFLRGTLLPLREALHGKFLASLYANFGIIAAAGWWIGLVALVRPIDKVAIDTPVLAFAILAFTWVFVTAVGTFASAVSKRTVTALVASYGALFAWLMAFPIVTGAFLNFGFGFAVATHPQTALVAVCHDTEHPGAVGVFFILYAGLTFLILRAAGEAVERLRERDP